MHLQTLAYEMNRIRSHPLKGRVVPYEGLFVLCAQTARG